MGRSSNSDTNITLPGCSPPLRHLPQHPRTEAINEGQDLALTIVRVGPFVHESAMRIYQQPLQMG